MGYSSHDDGILSGIAFLKPSFASLGMFMLFLLIHVLGSYGNAPLSDHPIQYKPPFMVEYYQALSNEITLLFWVLWYIISMSFFIAAKAFIFLLSLMNINIFLYLNNINVFVIFSMYYYFFASVIASVAKKD